MAKVRQIIKHVWVEEARGNRRCRRNRTHTIPKGGQCLVIRDDSGPFTKNYCSECAEPILRQCADNLRSIGGQLYPQKFGEGREVGASPTLEYANQDDYLEYANEDDYPKHDPEVVEVLVRIDRNVGKGLTLPEAIRKEGVSEEEVKNWQHEVGLIDRVVTPRLAGEQLDAFRLED